MASAAPAKVQEYTDLFTRIGLAPKFAAENAKSDKAVVIAEVIAEAGVQGGCDKSIGNLLHLFATTLPANRSKHRAAVSSLIAAQKIKTNAQVTAAVAFLKKLADGALNKAELEKSCGVGVEVSPAQIAAAVRKVIDDNKNDLMEQRYSVVGKLLGAVNRELQWADGKAVKDELDKQVGALLGPMTEEDTDPAKKKAALKAKQAAAPQEAKTEKKGAPAKPELTGAVVNDTADNDEFTIGRDLEWAHNTPEQLAARKAKFGDTIITRFPPEPNGFLHLGHAKAMYFDFGVATQRGGGCILRFDDTNPAEEKQLYIDKVIEACGWLGHKPSAITFSSDYFQELYDLAVKLIKKGLAYVCRQTGDEIEESRKARKPSPWRDRPIAENLLEFERMKRGYYDEGYCTLRMKGDIYHPMPCMWDLIAYRIKYIAHPHAGSGWCIYPSYDYTHCIIDSLEGVSYSLCTLEFETRRESYFWLLHVLELYKPKVWEYSRLNVEYNVMSKRKLKLLVEEGHVKDWDDPRLLTLMGLRRRGVPPEAINLFCSKVGISRNTQVIRQELFDFCVRQVLNESTPRAMVVQDPIKVTLTNYPAGKTETLKAPVHPLKPERGSRDLPFSRVIYIDREDFRVTDDPSFYRLAPGKTVHLLYGYNITCTSYTADPSGKVTHIEATVDLNSHSEDKAKKIKGKLHWVAEPKPGQSPLRIAELRQYSYLFKTRDCSNLGDDWREHIDTDSLLFLQGAYGEPSLKDAKVEDKFQFERLGFYCVDSDSKADQLIFNRTITLRDNKGKDDN